MKKSADKLKASALTSHIGFWMRMVSNNVSHAFAQKLEASGVTVAEWVILRQMYSDDETTSPSKVAVLTGLTRGAISKLIERLCVKKFVSRQEDSADRRYQEIQLTEKGFDLVPVLASLADKNDREFFSILSKEERTTLLRILKKLAVSYNLKKVPIK